MRNSSKRQRMGVLFLCCLILLTGLSVWLYKNATQPKVGSFAECKALGYQIKATSPAQCTVNGKVVYIDNNPIPYQAAREIRQGLKGKITMRSGNCMPSIGKKTNSCSTKIYDEPTKVIIKQSVNQENKEHKTVIKELSGVVGEFETELPVGIYNMYVSFNGQEYCNSPGGAKGEECEFAVKNGEVTYYTLQINTASD